MSVSQDRGDTWRLSHEGLDASYCRSVTVCGDAVLLSASAGPRGGHSAMYRSDVEGRSFERCTQGLPGWFEQNIDSLCLDAFPDGALAAFGTKDGRGHRRQPSLLERRSSAMYRSSASPLQRRCCVSSWPYLSGSIRVTRSGSQLLPRASLAPCLRAIKYPRACQLLGGARA